LFKHKQGFGQIGGGNAGTVKHASYIIGVDFLIKFGDYLKSLKGDFY